MNNLLSLLQMSLAYKAAALQLMTGEANWACQQLPLPAPQPLTTQAVVRSYVGSPRNGVNGSLETTHFAFTFWQGRLHTVTRTDVIPDRETLRQAFDRLAERPSLIDTNGAYQLATQWLAAVGVDVPLLNQRCTVSRAQRWFFAPAAPMGAPVAATLGRQSVPLFDVAWEDPNHRLPAQKAARVVVLGSSKSLVHLEVGDFAFSQRPPVVATNVAGLELLLHPFFLTYTPPTNSIWKTPKGCPPRGLTPEQYQAWLLLSLGEEVIQILEAPDQVRGYVLEVPTSFATPEQQQLFGMLVREGPLPVKAETARKLAEFVMDWTSYRWEMGTFASQFPVRIEYVRGTNTVDLRYDPYDTSIQLFHNRRWGHSWKIEPGKQRFIEITSEIFPKRLLDPPR